MSVLPANQAETAASAERRSRTIGFLLAAAGATLFSAKGIIIKLAYAEGINTETLLALRMALSLPFFAAVGVTALQSRRQRGEALPDPRTIGRAVVAGLIGYWFASYTDFLGLLYISAQFERLILFTYPGFVVLFGAMFFGQRVQPMGLVAFAISYLGLAVIFTADAGAGGSGTLIGAALVLSAAIAFAIYQLLAREIIARMGPKLFTCVAMSAAAVGILVQFALTQPLTNLLVSPALLGYGFLLAIGATVLPSFMLNAALQRISAQANSVIGTLSPVATIALAVLVLGEVIGLADVIGTVLVIAGVGWFTLADRK